MTATPDNSDVDLDSFESVESWVSVKGHGFKTAQWRGP